MAADAAYDGKCLASPLEAHNTQLTMRNASCPGVPDA